MILVGQLFSCVKSKRWRYNQACHLFCDKPESLDDLHKLAQRIGLQRSWFQGDSVLPHYDLTASKQTKAIKAGATIVSRDIEVQSICEWRKLKQDERSSQKQTKQTS